ncbi:MAG: MFS transporter [Firmicutes bacterium]|nr:MFS transporter [Bacillota bacterium]MBQ6013263.1 MFS transporter [Bacillota bacterium]MBQ6260663.1 MFS transporter [Bacillota bacterium]
MEKLKRVYKDGTQYRYLLMSILMTGLAYGIYKGIIDNYLAEEVGLTQVGKGVSEFFRELPGLLLVFILALLYEFSAEKIYKIGAVIMVCGMVMQSIIPPTAFLVILAMMIYSIGDHMQLGMKSAIGLQYAREGKGGESLGYNNAVNHAGTLVGYLIVILVLALIGNVTTYRPFLIASAALMVLAMFLCFGLTSNTETDKSRNRFYFNRKFYKYYMLEIFYGARKQVFFTFGPYVLILFYGASAMVISVLYAVSSVASFILAPKIGQIIDRFGYRIVMIMDTVILVVVCFFYGFAHHIFPRDVAFIVCCVNYLLDSVISMASMASSVYVQDISDSDDECRATISTGVSVNHLITILVALFGGWIWRTLGIETLFIISAVLGLCNSAYAATIKTGRVPKRK